MLRLLAAAVLAMLIAVGMLAWWVLESSGVAIVETHSQGREVRRTHVWYVETDDATWLEAGRPVHPWYLDIQANPRLTLHTDEGRREFDAATVAGRDAHDHVRALLREKYGLRDRILGLVIDVSPSIAVRLTPVGGIEDR
jgi:hypothetical protein